MSRECEHCRAPFPGSRPGRGGAQPRRRFCSSRCKDAARNAARRTDEFVQCPRCGRARRLINPTLAGAMCRHCAVAIATDAAVGVNTQPVLDRFARFVALADNGCLEWIGTRQANGYGSFAVAGRTLRAHRWAYEHFVGAIPEGLHIDHLCRNRACVNPAHLEAVTPAENNRRKLEAAR